jgi:hypothetical protein
MGCFGGGNNAILPFIILLSCCNDGGIGGAFGQGCGGGCDDLLWMLCVLCICGGLGGSRGCGANQRC